MLHFSRWKINLILAVCGLGILFAMPNLLSEEQADALPGWLPHKQISLGLDLQGGAHLLLEVDADSVVRERLVSLEDEVRVTLRSVKVGYVNLGVSGEAVTVTLKNVDVDREQAVALLRDIDRNLQVSSEDSGLILLTLNRAAVAEIRESAINQSLEIVRRRIDETGTREPTIQRQGSERILVQLPGIEDPDRIKQIIGKTAKLSFQLLCPNTTVGDALMGRLPASCQLLESDDEVDGNGRAIQYVVRKRVMVRGDNLIDAQASFQDNQPVVSFSFDPVGARKFGDVTAKNIGKAFAIILDKKVISAPVIRSAITGGRGIISGNFTVQETTDFALLLRAGALPAPLTILEERTVGPDLGADSVRAGKIAAVLGMAFVVVFMGVCYGLFGLAANVALLMNVVLLAAALSALQATLTLPGIAGVVLTIGMAVDANVLVFERIREEIANGRTPFSSVDAGYQRALTTIIDSNVTTFIAAILLFALGSGPVKGFGVTLAIGICTSMFTAVMVTRLIVVIWLRKTRPQSLPI
ncbi:MAG: protein translocase subunit SecD [Alphaproteobacteria bacterium]